MSETLIGICVQTALFILGGYAMVIRNDVGNKQLRLEITNMKDELKKLADVIITQAVQTTRLDNLAMMVVSMEKRVEDMRRGNGFIQRGKDSVDREY